MAKLTEDEAAKLAELQAKSEAPDEPESSNGLQRVLNVSVDLGDPEQVERAIRLGYMEAPAADDDEGGDDDEGEGDDEGPRRRGFFPAAEK